MAYIVSDSSKVTQYFARNLRNFMDARNIGQTELAKRTDLSKCTLSVWLSGCRFPSAVAIEKLANFFGVPFEDFFKDPEKFYKGESPLPIGDDTNHEQLIKLIKIKTEAYGKYFFIDVKTDGFEPVCLKDGLMKCEITDRIGNGDMILYNADGKILVGYLYYNKGTYIFDCQSERMSPMFLDCNDIKLKILAKVLKTEKEFKGEMQSNTD